MVETSPDGEQLTISLNYLYKERASHPKYNEVTFFLYSLLKSTFSRVQSALCSVFFFWLILYVMLYPTPLNDEQPAVGPTLSIQNSVPKQIRS